MNIIIFLIVNVDENLRKEKFKKIKEHTKVDLININDKIENIHKSSNKEHLITLLYLESS